MKKQHLLFIFAGLSGVVLVVFPLIGKTVFSFKDYFTLHQSSGFSFILWKIRIPQTVLAYAVGFVLAVAGLIYQTIFHNDLAGPYILGVSSGSAFGASLSIVLSLLWGIAHLTFLFSLFFGLSVTVLLLLIYKRSRMSLMKLILFGTALNFFFSSNIMLLYYFSDMNSSFEIYHWLMGTVNIVGYQKLLFFISAALPFLIFVLSRHQLMNALLLQNDLAVSKGINVQTHVFILILLSSAVISVSVSLVGPISFIGLMSPHIAKQIIGKNHKYSLILSGLTGGLLMSVCFLLSRVILYPVILPAGVITGFAGSLFFISLLFRKKIIKKT